MQFAAPQLRKDRDFVLEAVTQFHYWAAELNKEHLSEAEATLNKEVTLLRASKYSGPFDPFTPEELSYFSAEAREAARKLKQQNILKAARDAKAAKLKAELSERRAEEWRARKLANFQKMMSQKSPESFRVETAAEWFQARARAFLERRKFVKAREAQRRHFASIRLQCFVRLKLSTQKLSWLKLLLRNGTALERAPIILKGDRTLVLAAVRQDWRALRFANIALRHNDEELEKIAKKGEWMQAVSSFPLSLINAPRYIKSDYEVAFSAVKNDWRAFEYIAKELQDDESMVLAAMPDLKKHWIFQVFREPYLLEHAPNVFKIDKEVVLAAMHSDNWRYDHRGSPLQFVPEDYRASIEFLPEVADIKRQMRARKPEE